MSEPKQVAPSAVPEIIVDIRVPVPSIVGDHFVIDDTHEAEVFGPNDAIVSEIIDLEVQQLVDLGDREDESRAWLVDRTACAWVALFERGALRVASNVLCVLRITGPSGSDRVLRDLAFLQGSTIDAVEQRICTALQVPTIRPFLDFTTLDITSAGARTKRDRAFNFKRLMTVPMLGCAKMVLRGEVGFAAALVHPQLWRSAAKMGVPYDDPGFGVMDYKLSDVNMTPMQTQFIILNMVDVVDAIQEGASRFMNQIGLSFAANDIDLEVLRDRAQQLSGKVSLVSRIP